MRLLIIDNYDSFTYNLVQIVEQNSLIDFDIVRNDKIDISLINSYEKILISPGPGLPSDVNTVCDVIRLYSKSKSILGVCLGHEAIAEVYGGKLIQLEKIVHGVASDITIEDKTDYIFMGIPQIFKAGRYHSWIVDHKSLPGCIKVTATDEQGHIMALTHSEFDVKGIQFHPESIMTFYGRQIIRNWLQGDVGRQEAENRK